MLSIVADRRSSVNRSGVSALNAFHCERNSSNSATKRSIFRGDRGLDGRFLTVSIFIQLGNKN
jgi:hypothetical protein